MIASRMKPLCVIWLSSRSHSLCMILFSLMGNENDESLHVLSQASLRGVKLGVEMKTRNLMKGMSLTQGSYDCLSYPSLFSAINS
ncbi:hypothetical protein DER46DRAFT_613858 [Fusarium sp. MPI-SDFR-AT-0072]|nr:hypothetical protein DER46DRAFT_613858 [Fusarium sp. MPI-SDFR-AT-0072]